MASASNLKFVGPPAGAPINFARHQRQKDTDATIKSETTSAGGDSRPLTPEEDNRRSNTFEKLAEETAKASEGELLAVLQCLPHECIAKLSKAMSSAESKASPPEAKAGASQTDASTKLVFEKYIERAKKASASELRDVLQGLPPANSAKLLKALSLTGAEESLPQKESGASQAKESRKELLAKYADEVEKTSQSDLQAVLQNLPPACNSKLLTALSSAEDKELPPQIESVAPKAAASSKEVLMKYVAEANKASLSELQAVLQDLPQEYIAKLSRAMPSSGTERSPQKSAASQVTTSSEELLAKYADEIKTATLSDLQAVLQGLPQEQVARLSEAFTQVSE